MREEREIWQENVITGSASECTFFEGFLITSQHNYCISYSTPG